MNIFHGIVEDNTFKNNLFAINLTPEFKHTASIGIRPEDITPGAGGISFKAEVIQPELNGMDWIIHASHSKVRFSCRSTDSLQPGSLEEFAITPEKIHYFDKSGKRIGN